MSGASLGPTGSWAHRKCTGCWCDHPRIGLIPVAAAIAPQGDDPLPHVARRIGILGILQACRQVFTFLGGNLEDMPTSIGRRFDPAPWRQGFGRAVQHSFPLRKGKMRKAFDEVLTKCRLIDISAAPPGFRSRQASSHGHRIGRAPRGAPLRDGSGRDLFKSPDRRQEP